jgi:hypothetical protein
MCQHRVDQAIVVYEIFLLPAPNGYGGESEMGKMVEMVDLVELGDIVGMVDMRNVVDTVDMLQIL